MIDMSDDDDDDKMPRHNLVVSSLGSQIYCTTCGHGGCEPLPGDDDYCYDA